MTQRFTENYISKTLSDRRLNWLNKEKGYKNRKTVMKLQCETCNYIWSVQFKSIECNKGCPKCHKRAKYKNQEVKDILNKRNIIWIDSDKGYQNNWTKLHFKCAIKNCNYIWSTSFSSIIDGNTGCPKCSKKAPVNKEEIINIIKNRNIKWLNNDINKLTTESKVELKCLNKGCNHKWKTSLRSLLGTTHGCAKCSKCLKYTNDEIKELLNKKGIKWLSSNEKYKNNNSELKLRCMNNKCKYVWIGKLRSIVKTKYGCVKCSGCAKYRPNEIKEILNKKNIIWLDSTEYKHNGTSLSLKCKKCHHIWKNSLGNLHCGDGQGCPKCARVVSPTKEEILNILKKKNIIWLDQENPYKNQSTKMLFECGICKYQWKTGFVGIKLMDNGCPKCVECAKHTIEFVKEYCKNKHITVISSKYKNAHGPLDLVCDSCNYTWSTNFACIKNKNTGCPNCCSFKTEKLCRKYFEDKFQVPFHRISPSWLQRLQLDGYNEELNLAFEYNGEQHYNLIPYYHETEEDLKNQKDRDILKRKLCKQRKVNLITIPYKYSCQNEDKLYKFIDERLSKLKLNNKMPTEINPNPRSASKNY